MNQVTAVGVEDSEADSDKHDGGIGTGKECKAGSDEGICLWKYSYLNGCTSFNGGRLLKESDLNGCIACEDYGQDSQCHYRVPFTRDPVKMRQYVKEKLRRLNEPTI